MALADNIIEIPALGRPFQLGMLYDCRKDAVSPGITLWDYHALQKDLTIKPQPKTESEIIVSDSIDDKASALDISASLKASFLVGLFEVGGSAKYLQDTRKSKQQARVTIQYKTTTRYEQLTMSHLGSQNVSHREVFEHGTATHVVTAILYGAQAFFVFDREVSSTEKIKNIEGSLQATLTKGISVGGGAEVKYSKEEKENALKFRCKFHGDFSLEKNPVTFEDAMKVYETLPKMLGEDGEKAVPMRVWLYPLTKLDTRAAKMVHEIRLALIFDAEKILEELSEIQMQSNDLANDPIAETFPEIKKKIQRFKDLCKQHKQTFQKQLARVLPSIRGGGQEEGTLVDILTSVNQSPFNTQRLSEYVDIKKREINIVKSYLTILSEIQVITSQNKMEEIFLDPQNLYVVSFVFTSLHEEEPFLLSLQDWLQERFLQEPAKSTRSTPGVKKGMAWSEDQERTQNARHVAKSIKDFFSINQSNEKVRFVAASLPDVETPGASIYLYEDGKLVSKNFELPSKPLPLQITELRHDSVQLKFQPTEYGKATISSYLVEYKIARQEHWESVRTEDAGEMFLLKDLRPNTEYQFQYAACCKVGCGKSSDLSPPIKTLPISPPEKLRKVTVASSVISVAWIKPSIVASEVVIKEYKVEYRMVEAGVGKDQWTEKRAWSKAVFYSIEGLKPQTAYRIRVSAVCDNGSRSVPSEEVEITTTLEEEDAGNTAHQFIQISSPVGGSHPLIFSLPLKIDLSDASSSCLRCHFGEKNPDVPNKAILVVGGPQYAKNILINQMISYILGVQWEDNFRFECVYETTSGSKAGSSGSEITVYMVHHQKGFQIPYSLTIIDTRNFGNKTMKEKQVKQLLQQFCSFAENTGQFDAICFVAEAYYRYSLAIQKCIFNSILSMLGKDIAGNVQLLVTFKDGWKPPVLEVVKEADLQCPRNKIGIPMHFLYNHLALLYCKGNEGNHKAAAELSWRKSIESMKDFFDSLMILEEKSLTSTKDVLTKPQELEAALRSPPCPKIEQVQPNLVQIMTDALADGSASVSRYLVEFQITGKEEWQKFPTENSKEVREDVRLSIRCAAGTEEEFSQWSEEITCICPMKTPDTEAYFQGLAQTEGGQCNNWADKIVRQTGAS